MSLSTISTYIQRTMKVDILPVNRVGCATVVADGVDTIVLVHAATSRARLPYQGAIELLDCTAARRSADALRRTWEGACPPRAASPLRAGVLDESGVPRCECHCDGALQHLNCGATNASSRITRRSGE